MLQATILILLAATYRVVAATNPALVNFAPLMALTFCGAVYFRSPRMWLVPVVALMASDLFLNSYYARFGDYPWDTTAMALRLGCFIAAIGLGRLVAQRRNWTNLLSGALGGSLLFYIVTNTASWLTDPFYAQTAAGWWQALTVGHPEFPPTLAFFRHTLVSDLVFTGAFVLVMERAASIAGQPSLLGATARDERVTE